MPKSTEAELNAQRNYEARSNWAAHKKYIKEKCRVFKFTLTPVDADMIAHLESQDNITRYLRGLIRADMEKQKP